MAPTKAIPVFYIPNESIKNTRTVYERLTRPCIHLVVLNDSSLYSHNMFSQLPKCSVCLII